MATAGADVVGVDWRVPLDEARRRVGPDRAVQGNLDPALCLATPWPVVEAADPRGAGPGAAGAGPGHIFNLGHGVLPETDPGSWLRWSTWSTPRAGRDDGTETPNSRRVEDPSRQATGNRARR